MNSLAPIPEWLRVLAWVSTVAVSTAWFGTLFLRKRAAALRHLFWWLALGAPLAALPLTWAHPRVTLPVLPPSSERVSAIPILTARQPLAEPLVSAPTERISTPILSRPAPPLPQRLRSRIAINPWICAWLVGGVFFAARFFLSYLRLGRFVYDHHRSADEVLLREFGEAKRHFGIARKVRLLVGSLTPIPFCHGVLRPVVHFPESWREWSAERVQICLSHELAHIVRRDLFALLIGRLACIVCWFNPLVWFAAGRLRHEAEKAADDLVLTRGFSPATYAGALVALAERHQAAALSSSVLALAMARRNHLSSRVGAILDESLHRRAPGRVARWTISLAALGVLTVALTVRLTAASPEDKTTTPEHDLEKLDRWKREAIGMTAYRAIKAGDVQTIDSFLRRGLNADEDLQYGSGLLFQAVDDHEVEIVKLLLAHGADVNAKTSWGDTAAKRACWRGYREIADALIQSGATVDRWQYATGMGNVNGLEANEKKQPITAKEARDALYFAVASGHEDTFDWLWQRLGPLDAEQKEKLLGDLFENAAKWGQPEMLQHVQDLGASLEKYGVKALANAVNWNYIEAARYLLEAGVSPKEGASKANWLLRNAAGEGQLEMVRLLLDHGADINAGEPDSFTPLSWAAYEGKEDMCLLLLERGADGSIIDHTGKNAAWHAAGGEHCPKALEAMLKKGVNVGGTDKSGQTILAAMVRFVPPRPGEVAFLSRVYSAPEMEAYDARERRVVELLAAAGVDCKGQEGTETPLMSALESGHNAAAGALLDCGADFATKDKDGNTAIYQLIERGWGSPPPLDLLEAFLKHGDPNTEIQNPYARPATSYSLLAAAMMHATTRKDIEASRRVVHTLIAHGAHFPKTTDENTQALLQAAAAGSMARMQEAVRQGAPVNAADGDGWDALTVSVAMDYEDCANWLLANGAVPSNHEIKPRGDLLTFAVRHNRTALVDALIAKGAKANTGAGVSGLGEAIERGNLHIFEALLRAGADPKSDGNATQTFNGKTYTMHDSLLLYACIDHGEPVMAKALLDRGTEADPANLDNGRNLAWWAVVDHQPQVLQALLDHGADPTQKDHYGESALALARKSHPDLVPILEAAAKRAQDAATLGSKLANEEARRKFDAEPFAPDKARAVLRADRWVWQATAGYGKGDLRATVSFRQDESEPQVEVVRLVNEDNF